MYEFDKIKVTFEPHFLDSRGNETNGVGVDLYEIMMTIQEHPFLKDMEGVAQHFWNMLKELDNKDGIQGERRCR